MQVVSISTSSFHDQNPGTSGLRKKTVVFSQPNYTENFVQSIFDYLSHTHHLETKPFVLVVGGDGRYLCGNVTKTIIQMAAANHVSKVIVGQHALFSTPAVSHVIRKYKAQGGIILTASHNPGGPKGDFGIKFNNHSGGSANEQTTKAIFEISTKIKTYKKCPSLEANLETIGSKTFSIAHQGGLTKEFVVEVIDSHRDYVQYMKEIFDFDQLAKFIQNGPHGSPMKVKIDCLNGITGPYVTAIMKELGADLKYLDNLIPKPDFGGLHPDPNLTYAAALVESMKKDTAIDIGAAFDGDGDRYMVLGKDAFFVNPSDCVAIVAANAVECVPYFRKDSKLKGVARSMPTSGALESVASQLNIPFYMTPTGWKFFGNLMDAGKLSICGEESFGLGSDHIREKDGIWAFLCILSIMSHKNKPLDAIVKNHWDEFGRNFYLRYDYEELELPVANQIYEHLRSFINSKPTNNEIEPNFEIESADDFCYTDPVDGSISSNQGLIVKFKNGCKFTLRKSGTGSLGITLRLYFEKFVSDPSLFSVDTQELLKPLIQVCLRMCGIVKFSSRNAPSVIT